MITAKQLYDTYPHQQMRMYVQATHPALNAKQQAPILGALVKKFLFNFNNDPHGGDGWNGGVPLDLLNEVPGNVYSAFVWADTPEGLDFWAEINRYRPGFPLPPRPMRLDEDDPVAEPAALAAKPVKKPAKKRVGWWV